MKGYINYFINKGRIWIRLKRKHPTQETVEYYIFDENFEEFLKYYKDFNITNSIYGVDLGLIHPNDEKQTFEDLIDLQNKLILKEIIT